LTRLPAFCAQALFYSSLDEVTANAHTPCALANNLLKGQNFSTYQPYLHPFRPAATPYYAAACLRSQGQAPSHTWLCPINSYTHPEPFAAIALCGSRGQLNPLAGGWSARPWWIAPYKAITAGANPGTTGVSHPRSGRSRLPKLTLITWVIPPPFLVCNAAKPPPSAHIACSAAAATYQTNRTSATNSTSHTCNYR
jgi:hypothetical protein